MKMLFANTIQNSDNSLLLSNQENKSLINKLDNNKKKNLKNRTVISVFVALYYLVILILTFLSDKPTISQFSWISLNGTVLGVFAFILCGMVYVPFILAVLEALRLVFQKYEKIPIIILSILCSAVYILPIVVYLVAKYFTNFLILNNHEGASINSFIGRSYYLIVLASITSLFLLIIVLNIILKIYKKNSFKNVITLNILLLIIVFGFIGFIYAAISKGWIALLFLMISVMCTDVMCYLWGMFFGKHKMAKVISPNKTWEGAILGTITTVLLLLVYCALWSFDSKTASSVLTNSEITRLDYVMWTITNYITVQNYTSWLLLIFLSVLLVVFSILGDLLFSYVKRKFDIKDFSNLLKSHGGVLDRVDSLLMTSLVYFFYSSIAISIFLFSWLISH